MIFSARRIVLRVNLISMCKLSGTEESYDRFRAALSFLSWVYARGSIFVRTVRWGIDFWRFCTELKQISKYAIKRVCIE